jgi:ribonuclease HII
MPVEYISTPIRDERNRLCGGVVIFTDITERQAAEKQRQKDSKDLDEKTRNSSSPEIKHSRPPNQKQNFSPR